MRHNIFVRIAIQTISWFFCISPLGAAPFAYVCNSGDSTLSVIDVATNTVISPSPIAVGSVPDVLAITPDGKYVYVGNYSSETISVLDTATNTVIPPSPIAVGEGPDGIAVTPDGKYVYVCNFSSNNVIVIEVATNTVIPPSPITVGSGPGAIAITPDGKYVYVPNYDDGTVTVIEVATNTVIPPSPITVGNGPAAIAITPNGKYAYVCNQFDNTVCVIDIATNTVLPSPIAVGINPLGIAITPDGKYAYVCNEVSAVLGTVSVIDVSTNTVISPSPITVGPGPEGVAVTPDGKYVYVCNEFDSSVTIIEVATNTVLPNPPSPITVGLNPYDVAITPDQSPVAQFTVSINNLSATFDGSASSSPVGTIANYEWNFGDGSPVQNTSSPIISHIYGSFGSYTVTLIVTNSSGTSTYQTFTGQTVSNNGGASARAVQTFTTGIAPPSKFVGKTKLHREKKRLYLKTKWEKSTSSGIKKYEIFAHNKKIATICAKDSLKKVIRLHPHHFRNHVSKLYRLFLSHKYRIRAVGAHGVASPFEHVCVKP